MVFVAFAANTLLLLVNIYSAVFVASHIIIIAGILLAYRKEREAENRPDAGGRLKVSVIVPARDEASTLPALLESLDSQSHDCFEIVLINDRSSDSTLDIMNSYKLSSRKVVKVIDNRKSFEGKNPKQMALSLAESAATGEIFLYTDADCVVPPDWIEYMLKPFSDRKVGLVFGGVTVGGGRTVLGKFQRYDHILRYHYTAACAGLNMPTGGFGNNLAVRKTALSEIGGFEGLEYTVTEDAQLIAKIRDTGRWKIFAQTSGKSMVRTAAVGSWKELYLQELRWSTGAIHAPDIAAKTGYGFIMYQLLAGIILFIPAFFNPSFFPVFFTGIICMFSVSFTAGIHLRMGKSYWKNLLLSIFIAEFLFPVVTARATLRPGIIWKGSRLGK